MFLGAVTYQASVPGKSEDVMKHAALLLLVVAAVVMLRQPLEAQGCPHQFTANSQSSSSYIQYCVSDNGNITSIISPFNRQQIITLGIEGYGLCQESPVAEYHDYFTDTSPNWDPAQILSSSSSSIKISRTTADGNWTLVQTISKVTATGSIKLLMALTNNQSVDRLAYLLRAVDTFYSSSSSLSGASVNSAWTWDTNPYASYANYRLQLFNGAKSPFGYRHGFVRPWSSYGPNACDFAAGTRASGFLDSSPGNILYVYVGPVPAHGTRTVTLNYRGT
jgi:hypothetical protein